MKRRTEEEERRRRGQGGRFEDFSEDCQGGGGCGMQDTEQEESR